MENVKIGIIGSGFIAEHHCHAFSQLANVDIIALSSLDKEPAGILMKKYEIPGKVYEDYKDLLKLDCNAISVCVPNFLHEDVVIDALNSGKHVFVEKPLARTVAEGEKMLEAEKSSNRRIFYCENNMYAPSFSKVKEVINEGALGHIYMGRGKEQHSGPHSSWFYKREQSGGGALLDLGIHDIACLVWYLDSDVKEVFCQTKTIIPDRGDFGTCEVEDNALGVLYFDNDAQVVIVEDKE